MCDSELVKHIRVMRSDVGDHKSRFVQKPPDIVDDSFRLEDVVASQEAKTVYVRGLLKQMVYFW